MKFGTRIKRAVGKRLSRGPFIEEVNRYSLQLIDSAEMPCGKISFPDDVETVLHGQKSGARLKRLFQGYDVHKIGPDAYQWAFDVVNRYVFPHMLPAVDPPKMARNRRDWMHKQHRCFIAEEASFAASTKEKLIEWFTPQSAWVVFDIGAYMGYGSLRMSREIGAEGRVISVEAMPANQAIFEKNLSANSVENITLVKAAIWSSHGSTIPIETTETHGNSVVSGVKEATGVVDVPTVSIDGMIADHDVLPDLVSLTVNGAEAEALTAFTSVKSYQKPCRILAPGWHTVDGRPGYQGVVEVAASLGFECFVTDEKLVLGIREGS